MKKIFVSYAIVAMSTLTAIAPALVSADTLSNQGNGVDSTNNTTVNQNNTTSVSQTNRAAISNNISVVSNTGDNTANRNTGGPVNVSTGDAGTKVGISNFANQNSASVTGCGCDNLGGGATVTNAGNGDSSYNNAKLNTNNTTALSQNNAAEISNKVAVDSNTGDNSANRNTGGLNGAGGVSVSTGDSLVGPITIQNAANQNRAVVGSGTGAPVLGGSYVGGIIGNGGNGVDSHNNATVNNNNAQYASQYNAAAVSNYVGVLSNTGDNNADRNTGGPVYVDTGDSAIAVGLATNVNSNAAWVDSCGCVGLGGTAVKNLGNGDSAVSNATLNNNNTSAAAQTNLSEVANAGMFDSSTGSNSANRNTSGVMGWDPAVMTGTAYTNVGASTAANSNTLNSGYVAVTPAPSANTSNSGWYSWGVGYNGNMMFGF